jgi:mitochondrial cardiolipin hydrolase
VSARLRGVRRIGTWGVLLLVPIWAAACASSDVCFSPEGECSQILIEEIDHAQETIHAAVYTFTDTDVAQALAEAQLRGIEVQVALDPWDSVNSTVQGYLEGEGVQARMCPSPMGIMHHKFAVFDSNVVLTGSYNWTVSGDTINDENLVRLTRSEIAAQYEDEFDRIWARGDDN